MALDCFVASAPRNDRCGKSARISSASIRSDGHLSRLRHQRLAEFALLRARESRSRPRSHRRCGRSACPGSDRTTARPPMTPGDRRSAGGIAKAGLQRLVDQRGQRHRQRADLVQRQLRLVRPALRIDEAERHGAAIIAQFRMRSANAVRSPSAYRLRAVSLYLLDYIATTSQVQPPRSGPATITAMRDRWRHPELFQAGTFPSCATKVVAWRSGSHRDIWMDITRPDQRPVPKGEQSL